MKQSEITWINCAFFRNNKQKRKPNLKKSMWRCCWTQEQNVNKLLNFTYYRLPYHFSSPAATCCWTVYPNWACLGPFMIRGCFVSMVKQSSSPSKETRHYISRYRRNLTCWSSHFICMFWFFFSTDVNK